MKPVIVCALYRFVTLDDYAQLRAPLLELMAEYDIRGTLLLAREGINGTVSGDRRAIDALKGWFDKDSRLAGIESKESYHEEQPFYRSKVKLKKEIVTMGIDGIDPNDIVGTYVKAEDWNALISDPEVVLIDTRNDYEVSIGTFKGALNPRTDTFREFPEYVRLNLDPDKHRKVAMFCTGGIRCEKSTAYLKQQGFSEVYHLQGGILKYLQEVPEQESLWEGECFVFDNRVAVNHQLQRGDYEQCNACRHPVTAEDMQQPEFVHGVSCPHCYDKNSLQQRARFEEREKQMRLARERGEAHIGKDAAIALEQRRELKKQRKEQDRALQRRRQVSAR